MADIPIYKTLEEKKKLFENDEFFIINTKAELDRWFEYYSSNFKKEHSVDFIFRGMSEAKYKLFTSAQRFWITDNMEQWKPNYSYKDFVEELVNKAKLNPLLKKIFSLYDYSNTERDFPILSLLQHYGAPSPVLDWSYNINCATFFAIDGVKRNLSAGNSIDNYVSVYSIHKKKLHKKKELLSILDIANGIYPPITEFRDFGNENNPNSNSLFILSDFETTTQVDYRGPLKVKTKKPITSLYNQNIIPQEGLLMYNPFKDRPIENLFNVKLHSEGQNLHLEPFKCFNIHKDLTEYLRRLISTKYGIKKSMIYPHLYDDSKEIKEAVMNSIVR
ncbi:FRG domain-containing protein [Flavobacterium aquidurense]|jgi:hypothetical protein|uniref:FRG domain-containing protein n=1 Tax=Flavobacterium aquidurense TaxID=362413 RepID=UPI0037120046